jgi:hypothetical protein
MKTLTLTTFTLCLSFSAATLAQQTPAAVSTATPPAVHAGAAIPTINIGCAHDVRPEILQFCAALTDLQSKAAAGVAVDDPSLSQTFQRLNPADRSNANHFIPAISLIMAVTAGTLQIADQLRTDQQFGANSTASGTTSLVSKAGSAELISLALDTGAVTQSVNGSTSTLTTNADHVYRLITGQNSDCIMNCRTSGFENLVLNPLNISATFQLGQNNTSTTATTGQASGTPTSSASTVAIPTGAGKLTAIGAKYELLNKFDPRKQSFQSAWKEQVNTLLPQAANLNQDSNAVYVILDTDATFSAASNDTTYVNTLYDEASADHSGKKLISAFEDLFYTDIKTASKLPTLPAAVATVIKDRADFRDAWNAAVAAAQGNLLTFQYNYNKPLSQPATHDVTIVYGYTWGQSGSITANGAFSIYDGTLPVGAQYGRLHYGQVSGEYDRNLSNPSAAYQMQMSLAGYWQYQPDPSILNIAAGTVAPGTTIPLPNGTQEFVGTSGSLWVTQGKLTIKGPNGINIPVGVSWSNKTDLLQGSKVGAQIGLSYNFSTLAGLF